MFQLINKNRTCGESFIHFSKIHHRLFCHFLTRIKNNIIFLSLQKIPFSLFVNEPEGNELRFKMHIKKYLKFNIQPVSFDFNL